ncbi:Protein kinase, ATP binding site-containing protein [Cynara cardunculus var. scolymus]|uniref:Protein kinase, ATP binding site-containing protein n=1 Tax=Cynara cardunculus var. scolymus TaxID=59895 RepID=A0A118K4C4_CYNCS|nr:Protein kinase, ATP binding site-containing protein [Cynara cardunculus var. scolymus]
MTENLKNDYQVGEELGRGQFGIIYRCFSVNSGRSFACKSINKLLLCDSTDRECIVKEPKILQILRGNASIVQIHRLYEDENSLHMVMDLCDEPNLFDHISKRGGAFSESEAGSIFIPLIQAVSHCHRLGIAHRDIKPDNVLFDSTGKLKLADFGSAECFGMNESGMMTGVVGTPYYVAPEVLLGREYNEKVDVWSAGVILYILLAGCPPFYGETPVETFQAVLRGNLRFPPRIFMSVSPEAKDLLRKMLCKDSSKRLSAEQVLRHPWIHRLYEDENSLHMVMDLCDEPNLFDRLSKRGGAFSESEAASIFIPLIQAVSHCHGLGIAHRDIKPDNVLFDSTGKLKLADFGSAECFGMNESGMMTGVVETPYYVAPEVLLGREYNGKVDVWSAGVFYTYYWPDVLRSTEKRRSRRFRQFCEGT